MAKYTILLKDYLQDHELPTIFDEIEGFEDLFIDEYFDREIAFETEDLFERKLQHQANMIIPEYKKLITTYDNAIASLNNNVRTTENEITDLPVDSDEAEPNQKSKAKETGASITEALARIKYYEDKKYNLKQQLLNEFKTLFMLIY